MAENEIRILVVEDETLIAEGLKIKLERYGYTVAGLCYQYETALEAIKELEFDLLLSDINLGHGTHKKSGIELASALKGFKERPVIFFTGFSDKDTLERAAALQPSAYLVKPVNMATLYTTVQLAVNNFLNKKAAVPEKSWDLEYFYAKQGNKMVKLCWKDVYHLEYVKNYVKISVAYPNRVVLVRSSLSMVLDEMIPIVYRNNFVKINRGEAIAKNAILKMGREYVQTHFGEFAVSGEFCLKEG